MHWDQYLTKEEWNGFQTGGGLFKLLPSNIRKEIRLAAVREYLERRPDWYNRWLENIPAEDRLRARCMAEEVIGSRIQINWTNQTFPSQKRKHAEMDDGFCEQHNEKKQMLCFQCVLRPQPVVIFLTFHLLFNILENRRSLSMQRFILGRQTSHQN